MGFSFSKIFKPKPTIDTSEVLKQIDYKEGTLIAQDENHKLYVDIEELGGFPYLKTMLFGTDDINIKRTGCTITFVFKKDNITLDSDNTTIESTSIQKTGVFYTPMDFELSDEQSKTLKNSKATEVKFQFKKKELTLKRV